VNESTDVLGACYARETAKRGFSSDRAQLAALAALERLRAELAAAAAAPWAGDCCAGSPATTARIVACISGAASGAARPGSWISSIRA